MRLHQRNRQRLPGAGYSRTLAAHPEDPERRADDSQQPTERPNGPTAGGSGPHRQLTDRTAQTAERELQVADGNGPGTREVDARFISTASRTARRRTPLRPNSLANKLQESKEYRCHQPCPGRRPTVFRGAGCRPAAPQASQRSCAGSRCKPTTTPNRCGRGIDPQSRDRRAASARQTAEPTRPGRAHCPWWSCRARAVRGPLSADPLQKQEIRADVAHTTVTGCRSR